jgi:NodT family efflux transporter outer membrane factor (OMF) lipoprotein
MTRPLLIRPFLFKPWHLAAITAVLCTGCTIAPPYQRPMALAPAVFPASFKELQGDDTWKAANPSDGQLRGKWWELFGDPKLNELEEMVAVSNQNIKQVEAQFQSARALVDLQHANFFPIIGSSPQITESGGRTARTASFSLPISASWEADVWGRIRTAVEGSVDSAQIIAANLENIRLSVHSALASNYFALESLDMQYTILDDTIKAYETYLQLTINRFNGGVASRSDVALAQTQLANAQSQQTDLGVTRAQFEHAIAVLTGQAPANLTLGPGKIMAPPPPIPSLLPSQLLERRPDIAASERAMAAQNANVGLAKIAFYPTIGISASASLASNTFDSLFTGPARIWSAGPFANETVFDFGRRTATLHQAQANYDATIASYRQTVLNAFEDVEDNLAALRILATEAAQQQEAVRAAEQSLALITERYKAGTNSALDVITTQTIALNTERNAIAILQRRMTAAVNLIKALGGGWDASTLPSYDQLRSAEMADPKNTHLVAQPRTP